jgi:hypothetical protein
MILAGSRQNLLSAKITHRKVHLLGQRVIIVSGLFYPLHYFLSVLSGTIFSDFALQDKEIEEKADL